MKRIEIVTICAIAVLYSGVSVTGITWGLPSRSIDPFLFSDGKPWSGEKIYRLAGADKKFASTRGADVDADPVGRPTADPVNLTATDEDVSKIYLRFRLYTYQPDEMITMMALAGMRPGQLDFDPRLYQYGGLFIYPVGALINLCGMIGLIDVRGDVVYYLDNPDELGKFYVVARVYAAAWGLVGVIIVFAIARRLGGPRSAWLAALLFAAMPVVVCMAHEGKPHLPGAVLMLLAVCFAMRYLGFWCAAGGRGVEELVAAPTHEVSSRGLKPAAQRKGGFRSNGRDWWWMCICCGAALGMVLSSWPIFVLIPLVACLTGRGTSTAPQSNREAKPSGREGESAVLASRGQKPAAQGMHLNTSDSAPLPCGRRLEILEIVRRTGTGFGLALLVYLLTNPYVLINAITNRDVLRSNFGNSLAMYEISRVGEGLVRVFELTIEGATLPVVVLGLIVLIVAAARRRWSILPLAVPATVFFLQFVLIGAGKPAEYGRFGIFTNTALAIGTACLLARRWKNLRGFVHSLLSILVILWIALFGASYLRAFHLDSVNQGSRQIWATRLSNSGERLVSGGIRREASNWIGVTSEPAPYCLPPVDFSRTTVALYRPESPPKLIPEFQSVNSAIPSGDLWVLPYEELGDPFGLSGRVLLFWRGWSGSPAGQLSRFAPYPTQISWADKPFHTGVVRR